MTSLLYCLAWCCRFCIPVLLARTLTGSYIQAQFFSLGSIISIVQLFQTLNPIENHCNFRQEDGGTIHLGPIIHTSIFFFFFSFLFLEAKNFCSFIFFFEIMEAGARMREEGPATPTSILQQTRRHVHFGRFLKLLSALYHQRRYCFLVAVHIVCSVVIWGKSLIRRGSIAQVEHSSHASFSSLILVTITGTSVNAPSSSSNPSFNIQHTTD